MLQVAPQIVGQQLAVTVPELVGKACRMRRKQQVPKTPWRGFRRQWLAFKPIKRRTRNAPRT
jgi:hypothetical protein